MLAQLFTALLACCMPQEAPPGRWLAPGGDAAQSSRSLAAPIEGEPEVLWNWESPYPIEGAVSVWDGRVLLSARESAGRRRLVLLDQASGKPLLEKTLRADQRLRAVTDGDRIAVRPRQDRVDLYRLRGQRLGTPRAIQARHSISAPLLVEGQLFVRVDDALERYDTDSSERTWRAQLPGVVRGRPALLGERVFALFYSERGEAQVAILDRQSGKLLASAQAGNHGGKIPKATLTAELFPRGERIFIQYPLPVNTRDGARFAFGSLEFAGGGFSSQPANLHNYRFAPLAYGDGWIASESSEGFPWLRVERPGGAWAAQMLADDTTQPSLGAGCQGAILLGDRVHFGGLGADLRTNHVLWKRPAPLFRPTPIPRGLLVVEDAKRLTCLGTRPPPAGSPGALVRKLVDSVETQRAQALAELAKGSTRLGDASLSKRLIRQAQAHGAAGEAIDAAWRAVDRIAANSKPANPAGNRYRALIKEEQGLLNSVVGNLGQQASQATGPEQVLLLKACLERAPADALALRTLAKLLPPLADRPTPHSASSWIEYLEVATRMQVETDDLTLAAEDQLLLAKERDRWRADLGAFHSKRLLVLAPWEHAGAVARCLEYGELLSDVLEELVGKPGAASRPLVILLYPTQAEYLRQSQNQGEAPEASLGWTAGHYNPAENRTRLFLPPGALPGDPLLSVMTHELTHHWLANRGLGARQGRPDTPFWIVEGFATLMSELRLDPKVGRWEPRNPRAGSLDALRALPQSALIPWEQLLAMDQTQFAKLSKGDLLELPLTWSLGLRTPVSPTRIFYIQASALCQMLFNSTPAGRAQLIEYAKAWYRQDLPGLDAERAFGASASELGQRAEAFARR